MARTSPLFEGILRRDTEKILAAVEQTGFVAQGNPERVAERMIEYSLGHQLIFTLLSIASGGLAYLLHTRGNTDLAQAATGASALFLVGLLVSMLRHRKRRSQPR